ncbi:hypothetical protein BKA58DRAFT_190231 [Alternaria rosae]|uniref:uncharacterized protein n=1 Tax=Alternaria rosae TaxID=1187941 RepID=UPI001E8E1C9A|nr:uncharacterized protein BKA58DRAFT_190231 [Alternaria rosae]KAH6868208.1 hypothetical protein BKA58DRAFT_190231 [Alternaria rosae]
MTGHCAPYLNNLPHGLVDGCNICSRISSRIECSGCTTVHYCCSEHQALHRAAHQTICDRIQRLNDFIAEYKDALPCDTEGGNTPLPTFRTTGGNYTLYEATEMFAHARRNLVQEFVKLNTKTAVGQVLDDTFTLLRLDPEDHLGMRCMAPWLFLRL